jgi:hypothetical protein
VLGKGRYTQQNHLKWRNVDLKLKPKVEYPFTKKKNARYNKIMRNVQRLGERYCRKYLDSWDKERLQNDWWEALNFFFSHSFMRGRRDELSNEYYHFTIKVLEDYFSITNGNPDSIYERLKKQKGHFHKECILKFKKDKDIGRGNSIKHQDFRKEVEEKNPIVKLLITPKEVEVEWDNKTYNKKIFLGNGEDVMMVLDVLKFISNNRKNIYNHLKNTIVNSGVKTAYKELIGIRAISDKIATFVIRDIGLINLGMVDKDPELAFPVDTWVVKIAHKLGCSSKDSEEIKNYLIKKCKKCNIDPLEFAAGLWFLGFHSLDILLETLGRVEI